MAANKRKLPVGHEPRASRAKSEEPGKLPDEEADSLSRESRAKSEAPVDDPMLPGDTLEQLLQLLPDEIVDLALDPHGKTNGYRLNRRYRARHSAPTNAVRFWAEAPNWTLDGLLDHLREIKNYTQAGVWRERALLRESIERALEKYSENTPVGGSTKHLSPLARVLHALYPLDGAAPEFTWLQQHITIVTVQPIFKNLPELWYIRFIDGQGKVNLGISCEYTKPLKERVLPDLAEELGSFLYTPATAKDLEPDSGWAKGATPAQRKALVFHLHNEAARIFYDNSSKFICTNMLLQALRKDRHRHRGRLVLVHDACA